MSGRGGKRRQVLQLGAASKLHRYGYSKEFQSRDKKGKISALNLVGEYSDTNSEDDSEAEEQVDASNQDMGAETSPVHETIVADNSYAVPSPSPFPEGTNGSGTQDKPSDMDDELKNFLSEIEAIPMPTALDDNEQPKTPEPEAAPAAAAAAVDEVAVTVAETRKPSMYSMFVKGESEFVHSPKQTADGEDKVSSEINEEEIPEEPLTSWQVVQDENTQYMYYWNTVTNEVTWEIPLEYTQYLLLHKEYEEKMAKLSPKQLQEIKERKAKMEDKAPCMDKPNKDVSSILSVHELKTESQSLASSSLPSTSVDRQDEKEQKASADGEKISGKHGDVLSNERVSPHREASHDSRRHKQKKEKKNHHHHKRKHKHRHENSHSDEDKPSPKAHIIGPLLVSTQPSSAVVVGQKLPCIVPYLSDQDEDDDNLEAMPVQGPALPAKEPNIREHKQEESAARDTAELSSSVMSETVHDQKTSDLTLESAPIDFIKMLLLPPPLPPPLPEEEDATTGQEPVQEDSSVSIKDNTEETSTNESQPNITSQTTPERHSSDTVQDNSPAHAVIDDPTEDPTTVTQIELLPDSDEVTKETSDVGINHSNAPETKKEQPKEFIDMFADNFPLPIASQGDEENVTVASEDHLKEVLQKADPPEELMEEGEIQDTLEEKTILQENSIHDSVVDNQKAVPKSLNIVGYASDDEEEEAVELQEKVLKRSKSSSSKQKKKDRKKDSKKRKKEKDSNHSNSAHKSREQKVAVKDSVIAQEVAVKDSVIAQKVAVKDSVIAQKVIPDGITPDVPEVIVKDSKKLENNDVDIDFEDFYDIDRALEVALEKKIEKNKHRVDDNEMKSAEEIVHSLGPGEELSKKHSSSTEVAQDANVLANNSIKVETKDDTVTKLESETVTKLESETSTSKQDEIVENIEEMAELALNKLEFLDISTDNLSRLQILFIELQTRRTDWKSGGLSTQYYHKQLQIAQDLLEQYELSAVPEGWVCQWDRANNRYYYRNKITNQIQWEYPEGDEGEKKEAHAATNSDESGSKVRSKDTDDHHKSRGSSSRHRKREEKDKNKYEKRSSSHHYRRKRRRGRDQSNSSDTSRESQHRHHRKSKKKKRRRSERSPSIEIVEDSGDNIDGVEIVEMTDAPNSTSQTASPSPVTASDIPDSSTAEPAAEAETASIEPDVADQAVDGDPIQSPPPREDDGAEALGLESPAEVNQEETPSSVLNPAVISKPPQIIINPQQISALHLNIQTPEDLHTALSETTTSAQASLFQPYPALPVTEQAQPTVEVPNESSTVPETDKKKKKKEKKSLATGSSIMMKKKHMSSMVQKWEKVKIEVEREDRAKELRQAAIRKKIEELKSSDKQAQS